MKEISWEVRERAEELYIVDGLTLEQVAKETGISIQSLKKWSAKEGWLEQKKEFRQALGEIKRKKVLLRKKLIDQALNSLNPQHVYAVSSLETTAKQKAADEPPLPEVEKREIHTVQDAIDALQEAVERKINIMLSRPRDVSLSAVKDMKKALELIDEMKARYRVESDEKEKKSGLSEKNLREIEKEILHLVR